MKGLDIGPGTKPLEGTWDTVDAHPGYKPTYLCDARKLKPVPSDTYDVVHSSHVIEHIEWYEVEQTLAEWARVVKPGGNLEVWTVNGPYLMKMLIEYEETGKIEHGISTWKDDLIKGDKYKHVVGRLMNYPKKLDAGGGNGNLNLHRSLHGPRYLRDCFERIGLINVRDMKHPEECRGHKHGWINFGVCGTKPLRA